MAQQYWVAEFFVDLTRNQISHGDHHQTLPPKALQVLTYLAENRGKVVTYEEIFDEVWRNSVVTPNTLQRSVAQLRKALGENSKAQNIIKTHSKQGYSLECEVKWQDVEALKSDSEESSTPDEDAITEELQDNIGSPEQNDSSNAIVTSVDTTKLVRKRSYQKHFWAMSILAILVAVTLLTNSQNSHSQMQVEEIRYLTATDDKEFDPQYTADGKFIIFNRYPELLCISHILAKDSKTHEEFQLTNELGTYRYHSLSPDGENLVFIKHEDCTKPVEQNTCYKLMSLNFPAALREPQVATELLSCENSKIKTPIWIDDQRITMLQNDDRLWRIVQYNTESRETSDVYAPKDSVIITYTWSTEHQLFAATTVKNDGKHYLEIIHPDGTLHSINQIQLPDSTSRHARVYPKFIPDSDNLVFGDGNDLFTLSFDGYAQSMQLQLDENVGGPNFHPDGDRILMIKGIYDSDVARLSLQDIVQYDQPVSRADYQVFERSINHEDIAKYRPGTEQIAFVSEKTGSEEVWLTDNGSATKISYMRNGASIADLHWDSKGDTLLVLADDELRLLSLDGTQQNLPFQYPVLYLLHWDSTHHLVTAKISVNGVSQLVTIDLNTLEYATINNKRIQWAAKDPNGPLIYVDHLDRFWQKTSLEDKLLPALTGQLGVKQRFVVQGDVLYGINDDFQLWSYNLTSEEFTILSQVYSGTDYITDIRDNELLLTFVIAAKKEVIELALEPRL